MANVHIKKIERMLKKEGFTVDGMDVVNCIEEAFMAEADQLGMSDGITEPFEFVAVYSITNGSLTFHGKMVEDYRNVGSDQEIPYYYPSIESFTIQKTVGLDVYW
jgi:hypothetical protein